MNTNVAHINDFPVGTMRMVKVDSDRVCLVRTSGGVFALDSACPHVGYGLTQGTLKDGLLTCQWHNWKFDVTSGACIQGEENVRTHTVTVDESGAISVAVAPLDPAIEGPRLLASLQRGIERGYGGQIARDTVRLLSLGVLPAEIMTVGVIYGAARGEWGWGHEIALASDCLALTSLFEGSERALPLVQALGAIAEGLFGTQTNDFPAHDAHQSQSVSASRIMFSDAVEDEDTVLAQTILLGALANGVETDQLLSWFIDVVAAHHLSYGHGAIYVQKAWELLDHIGWQFASLVLGHLVTTLTSGTREDTLPYMRSFMRALSATQFVVPLPSDEQVKATGLLTEAILNGPDPVAVLQVVTEAMLGGCGVHGVLDAAIDATSHRMLRYDTNTEFNHLADFGWLDITHGITYAHAIRQLTYRYQPPNGGDDSSLVRLTHFAVFLAHYTGRHERSVSGGLIPDLHVTGDVSAGTETLLREALHTGESALWNAHVVKTMYAATREHDRRSESPVLAAAARFMRAPKLQHRLLREIAKAVESG